MRLILGMILILFSAIGYSQTTEESVNETGQVLYDAITLCSSPNDPIKEGLKVLNGNLFRNVRVTRDVNNSITSVRAEVWHSLYALNRAIMVPDVLKGEIVLEMFYERSGPIDDVLVCKLKTQVHK